MTIEVVVGIIVFAAVFAILTCIGQAQIIKRLKSENEEMRTKLVETLLTKYHQDAKMFLGNFSKAYGKFQGRLAELQVELNRSDLPDEKHKEILALYNNLKDLEKELGEIPGILNS